MTPPVDTPDPSVPGDAHEADVYRTGALRDLWMVWRCLRCVRLTGRQFAAREARKYLRWVGRSWRRRSYWNGYLAEIQAPPRCGHGWTKRRALRSLASKSVTSG